MGIYQTTAADRTAIAISGTDRVDFLQNLITQNIERQETCIMAALLTPQGKLAYDFLIFRRPDCFVLDCDSRIAEALIKRLQMYKLRAAVEITPLTETPLIIWSDDAEPLPSHGGKHEGLHPDARHKALGLRGWFATPPSLSLQIASPDMWTAHRIGLGIPQGAEEMPNGAIFPLEFGFEQMNAIDFNKGCFIGQEVSSRVHRKGQLRKSLWVAEFEGAMPAQIKGVPTPITTDITGDSRQCGQIITIHKNCGLVLVRNDSLDKPLKAGQSTLHNLSGLFDFL